MHTFAEIGVRRLSTAYPEAADVYPDASNTPRVDKPVRPAELRDALLLVLRRG